MQVDPDALFDQFTRGRGSGPLVPSTRNFGPRSMPAPASLDQADRARSYEEANRIVAERALVVPFVHVKAALVHSRKVTGYRPSPIFWEGLFDVRLG